MGDVCLQGEDVFCLVCFLRVEVLMTIIGHTEHLAVLTWKPGLPASSQIMQDLGKPGIAPSRREYTWS